ncbi:hypothetical protein C2G38_2222822 [Gigaspora rosea]|uniref:Uncharacterized protein n=1 Tax=Gigaspora rosea TaxID=44941 RepID=A0A397U686_9GLOM|nr:hypothetical protein C2G38_2222822 [Gigaspora rosea]
MDLHCLSNVNNITKVYKEYLSIEPNCFDKFHNKLIAAAYTYCHVYNILDEKPKFSYKHLKRFSWVFPYISEALKYKVSEYKESKYEESEYKEPESEESEYKESEDKESEDEDEEDEDEEDEDEEDEDEEYKEPEPKELEYEGSIKWTVHCIDSINPHYQFKAKLKSEDAEDAKKFLFKDIISYDFLRNEDLLLTTKNGVYIYSLDKHKKKIYEKFNGNIFIDVLKTACSSKKTKAEKNKVNEENKENFKLDLNCVSLDKLELYLDTFKYILNDTLILVKNVNIMFAKATKEKNEFIAN